MARRLGWRAAHFPTANPEGRYRTVTAADAVGYPDATLLRHRVVWIEFKSEKGRLSDAQAFWCLQLLQAGQELYVARPSDSEAVQRVLEASRFWAEPEPWATNEVDLIFALRRRTWDEVRKAFAKVAA